MCDFEGHPPPGVNINIPNVDKHGRDLSDIPLLLFRRLKVIGVREGIKKMLKYGL